MFFLMLLRYKDGRARKRSREGGQDWSKSWKGKGKRRIVETNWVSPTTPPLVVRPPVWGGSGCGGGSLFSIREETWEEGCGMKKKKDQVWWKSQRAMASGRVRVSVSQGGWRRTQSLETSCRQPPAQRSPGHQPVTFRL